MWIYLIRHGPAGKRDPERWPDDARRPLTLRGTRRTERAARGLANLERRAVCLLTSPLERALQTAQLLEQSMALVGPVQIAEELVSVLVSDPNASVKVVVEISAEFPDGAKDQLKRAVSENSRSLGLKSADWE